MVDGKLFIVTGANSSLGTQLILDLSRRCGSDRVIATTRSEFSQTGTNMPNVLARSHVDLSRPEGSQALTRILAEQQFDRLYLVHVAGTFPNPGLLTALDVATLKQTLEDNVLSFAGAMAAVLPPMRSRGFGRILAFSAHTAAVQSPYFGAFDASKLALESLVKTAANEGAKYGIAVNALAMATLAIPAELKMKPRGDHKAWLTVEEASATSLDILDLSGLVNGNIIHCWRHSNSFFGMSVMERNSLDVEY